MEKKKEEIWAGKITGLNKILHLSKFVLFSNFYHFEESLAI